MATARLAPVPLEPLQTVNTGPAAADATATSTALSDLLGSNSSLLQETGNQPLNLPPSGRNRNDYNPYSKMKPSLLAVFIFMLISFTIATISLVTFQELSMKYPWYWIPVTINWCLFLGFYLFVTYARKQLWKEMKDMAKKVC